MNVDIWLDLGFTYIWSNGTLCPLLTLEHIVSFVFVTCNVSYLKEVRVCLSPCSQNWWGEPVTEKTIVYLLKTQIKRASGNLGNAWCVDGRTSHSQSDNIVWFNGS